MPGTVKSELLPDADRLHKCDGQEKVCEIQHLPLDKSHFITVYSIIKLPNITLYLETNNVLRNLRQVIIGSTGIIIWAILIKQWTIEIIPIAIQTNNT